jgi:alpha-glucosidase/lysosomal alpha-glucosidase
MLKLFLILVGLGLMANPYSVDGSVNKNGATWTFALSKLGGEEDSVKDNPTISKVDVVVESIDTRVLHIKMTDKSAKRFEPPMQNMDWQKEYTPSTVDSMGFVMKNSPFSYTITDPKTQEVLISTDYIDMEFQYQDKYLIYYHKIFSQKIFGLGEQVGPFRLCQNREVCKYSMWNKDSPCPISYGDGGVNCYGTQPFYLVQLDSFRFFGVLLNNVNGEDAFVKMYSGGKQAQVGHSLAGGILDFYFFYSGTAEEVLQKYHAFIGRPYLPPMWAMGWNQCRYGWSSLDVVKGVVSKYQSNKIPLDVIWNDIDYMDGYADFTVGSSYSGLKAFIDQCHNDGMHFVPIIDAGVKVSTSDNIYNEGMQKDAFIKSAKTGKALVGKVWPGSAVFGDFYKAEMTDVWVDGFKQLDAIVHFDGIWLDMNEIANFCFGECSSRPEDQEPTPLRDGNHDINEFNNLPFTPANQNLNDKCISITGYHWSDNDDDDRLRKEYNTHNLFGIMENIATFKYFDLYRAERPFILSRSNTISTGKYASIWLGDNFSNWDYFRYSIPGIMNYQLFGVPLVGSDICGFLGDTNAELCMRWTQLGAFYPFSRNHNNKGQRDQYPWDFGEEIMAGIRNAILQKYTILRYYYTKMFESSLYGGTVVRPMFFEFPFDDKALDKTPFMFMIGPALMVSPVCYEQNEKIWPYFPNANWYDLRTNAKIASYVPGSTYGVDLALDAKYDYVNVHLRGGNIIPYQDVLTNYVMNTVELNTKPTELKIALDQDGKATGTFAADDGLTKHTLEDKIYSYYKLQYISNTLTKSMINTHAANKKFPFEKINKITLLGYTGMGSSACLKAGSSQSLTGTVDSVKKTLTFSTDFGLYDLESFTVGQSC